MIKTVLTIPSQSILEEESRVQHAMARILVKRTEEIVGQVMTDAEANARLRRVYAPATMTYMFDDVPIAQLQYGLSDLYLKEIDVTEETSNHG